MKTIPLKNLLLVTLVFLISQGIFAQPKTTATAPATNTQTQPVSDNPNAPKIEFEKETIDYGTIEHKSDGNREFVFKNTGKEPLIITNCKGSCGCTVPTWPKEPIAPGATASIKVKYATDRVGPFTKTVTVTSNASTPTKTLKITGKVLPDPNAQPQEDLTPVKKTNPDGSPVEKN
jgi:hypothetical protein